MHLKDANLIRMNSGGDPTPVERRVVDTVKWVIAKYGIDPDRVYLTGISMGGSGTLGIGMRNGDVFAAIKASIPAGIEHVSHRMSFQSPALPLSEFPIHRLPSTNQPRTTPGLRATNVL
jgi:poly(3-hydroxybutyrate) depolymerase